MDLWAAYYGTDGEDQSGNGRTGTLAIPNTQPVETERCNAGTVTTLFDFEHVNDTVGRACPLDWQCSASNGGRIYGGAGCQSASYWSSDDCVLGPWDRSLLRNFEGSSKFYQMCASSGEMGIDGWAVSPVFDLPANAKELRYLHTGGSDDSAVELWDYETNAKLLEHRCGNDP